MASAASSSMVVHWFTRTSCATTINAVSDTHVRTLMQSADQGDAGRHGRASNAVVHEPSLLLSSMVM
jgi:hypothetical protein